VDVTWEKPVLDEAEVVVVGGGPAGAVAAFTLAKQGRDVLLIDRESFPREKACGDGLSSSAVSFLHALELDGVLADAKAIDGARLFGDWRVQDRISMRSRSAERSWDPCSIPRRLLDAALVEHACAVGARLLHGYVTGPLRTDDGIGGVAIRRGNLAMAVPARHIIAADGATSRLRRELSGGFTPQAARSYAVRRYVQTDEPLEVTFDIYAGVGDTFAGYGWVFPIAEHLANVGIGYMSARGVRRPRSATDQLDAFVAELQLHRGSDLGALAPLAPPRGAPLGIGFSAARCELEGVLFVGDAARTCDPITGEGIDQAMRSAHAAATALQDAIRRGTRASGIGRAIARSNLRLGQDSAMIARLGGRLLRRRPGDNPDVGRAPGVPLPLLAAARGMLAPEIVYPSLSRTPAGTVAAELGFAEFLRALDERIRDRLGNEFVMTSELLYREVCAGLGPLGALLLTASLTACRAQAGRQHLDAALCAELLCTLPSMLSNVTHATDDHAKTHNALAVTTADFALAQACTAAARFDPRVTGMLAEAIEASSAAAALIAEDRHDAGRPARRYMEWAALGSGAALSMAARMGACLADAEHRLVAAVGPVGESLGVAVQICEDVLALLRPDPVTGRQPHELIEQGDLRLPVLLALEEQPNIGPLLTGRKDRREWEGVVGVIRESGAVVRASEMCREHAESAKDLATMLYGGGNPLAELCNLPQIALSRVGVCPTPKHGPPVASGRDVLDIAS
jgi:geranylgeranyl reductase family protein